MMQTLRARVRNGRLVAVDESPLTADEERGLIAAFESARAGRVVENAAAMERLHARLRR